MRNSFSFHALALVAAVSFRTPEIIPQVSSVDCDTSVEVSLDAGQTVEVACADRTASDWVRGHLKSWLGVEPKVVASAASAVTNGYRLAAEPNRVRLEGATVQDIRYAMQTLRQVVERDSSGLTVTGYRMPKLVIDDHPALAFRGLHLCWFPELSAAFIERQIRVAAAYKYNVVVLESWGVFKSDLHPWFGWSDGPMTKEAIRRLVAVANDLGVTLVPQVNVFGHAAASRSCSGKHATIDFAPERQSLFEPFGNAHPAICSSWNWCLSNPDAVRVVRDLVVELHEAFGNPPFFHIGCDEADEPMCASCRATSYAELVNRHISGICEILKARGARPLMWHDMLIERDNPRWKGFYANGDKETVKLVRMLPKDVIVCDWYYDDAPKSGQWTDADLPTLAHFSKELGFDTLTCPWVNKSGTRALTAYAREQGLYGVLATVWDQVGSGAFPKLVQRSACGAWGNGERYNASHFATAWRQTGWDSGTVNYREAGWIDVQISRPIR